MKKFRFKKIDAFTDGKSAGNPAGVIYHAPGEINDSEMLQVAKELKGFVNEVVYVSPLSEGSSTGAAELKFQYYSSECEVEFCGHGTIAAMYDIITGEEKYLRKHSILIETNRGVSTVYNSIDSNDSLFISAPLPGYTKVELSVQQIALALGIQENAVDPRYELDLINAGLRTLIVPIRSLEITLGMQPDFALLQRFCLDQEIDIVIIFTTDVFDPEHSYRTRVFAPRFGYLEDPATGSGNAALGYYLLKQSLWNGRWMSLEQGPERENCNVVKIDSTMEEGAVRILFGGKATVRIDGSYLLY